MNVEELKQRALLLKGPNKRLRHLKYADVELVNYLNENYPDDITFAEKLYWFTHDIITYPVCHNCGKRLKFKDGRDGYGEYCSTKCMNSSAERKNKISETKLRKYGDPNYNNREKAKKTSMELYGVDNPRKNKEVIAKAEQTTIDRYGVPNVMMLDTAKEKSKNTRLKRYGDPNYVNKEQTQKTKLKRYGDPFFVNREQSYKTKLERYGDPHYANPEKRKQTCLKRYGYESSFQNPLVREKIIQTNIEKYGFDNPLKNKKISKKLSDSIKKSNINRYNFLLGYTDDGSWICKCPHPECNSCKEKQFIIDCCLYRSRENEHAEICTTLNPISSYNSRYSGIERFVCEILDEYNIEYEHNNKKLLNGLELDFYIPSKNLAIECNGCFWHCSTEKPKDYHINKYKMCREQGIRLISLWEDQLLNKKEIVRSMLISVLGVCENIINVNECELCEIKSSAEFLNENYIYGVSNSSINIGLKHNDEVVCLMGFSKVRKNPGHWNINYLCSKLNTHIPGFEQILIDEFIKKYHPNQLTHISYNDIGDDWFCQENHFERCDKIMENHWFIQHWKYDRYKKDAFSISKLKKMGAWDEGKTFDEIMNQLYFRIIYDSGKTRWTKTIS